MRQRRDAGFSLAALIFFATAASIALATAVPAYRLQAQREMEEELIFRGEEYVRAIQKYQRKFMVNPSSIDALVETNGLRFLRREYKDPITGNAFRLISMNADGTVVGSTILQQRVGNTPLFGGNLQTLGQPGQTQPPSQPTPPTTPAPTTPATPTSPMTPLGQNRGPGTPAPIPDAFGRPNTGTAGIIGVASESQETSVKVYNNRQKYNEWEFIALQAPPGTGPGAGQTPNTQNPPGQMPLPGQTPNTQNPPGQMPPLNIQKQ